MSFPWKQYGFGFTVPAPVTRPEWVAYRNWQTTMREQRERQRKMLLAGLFSDKPVYHHGDRIW